MQQIFKTTLYRKMLQWSVISIITLSIVSIFFNMINTSDHYIQMIQQEKKIIAKDIDLLAAKLYYDAVYNSSNLPFVEEKHILETSKVGGQLINDYPVFYNGRSDKHLFFTVRYDEQYYLYKINSEFFQFFKREYVQYNFSFKGYNIIKEEKEYNITLFLKGMVFVLLLSFIIITVYTFYYIKKCTKMSAVISKSFIHHETIRKENKSYMADSMNKNMQRIRNIKRNISNQLKRIQSKQEKLENIAVKIEETYNEIQQSNKYLKNEKEEYQFLLNNFNNFIFTTDYNFVVTYANDYVINYLEVSKEKLIGSSVFDYIFNKKYRSIVEKTIDKSLKNEKIVIEDRLVKPLKKFIFIFNSIKNSSEKTILFNGINNTDKEELLKKVKNRNISLNVLNNTSEIIFQDHSIDKLVSEIYQQLKSNTGLVSMELYLLKEDTLELSQSETLNPMFEGAYNNFKGLKALKDNKVMRVDQDNYEAIYMPLVAQKSFSGVLFVLVDKNEITDYKVFNILIKEWAIALKRKILYSSLKEEYLRTINTFVKVIEAKDKYTEGHSLRVAEYCQLIARYMGLNENEIEEIKVAGLLHDIGKIGIPDDILFKKGKLSSDEYGIIKNHSEIGYNIIESIELSNTIKEGILFHHKRYDLKGYPSKKVEKLPLYAEILALADSLDAMLTKRSYSDAQSLEYVLEEINRCSGSQFSPTVVKAVNLIPKEEFNKINKK